MRRSRATFRPTSQAIALVMLLFVTPGALELVEDTVHFLVHGDSLHDDAHESDHCCSGAFHFCSCHARSVAAPMPSLVVLAHAPRVLQETVLEFADPRVGPADDHTRQLDRPPAA